LTFQGVEATEGRPPAKFQPNWGFKHRTTQESDESDRHEK
jgi:hypothetical protein